tara:strand:+ start:457 stop:627 length:171 start_codon:yes stop_codon:yes gene_type:complete
LKKVVIHIKTADQHHSVNEMIDSGSNLERNVHIDAIKTRLDFRVMAHGKRTIMFNK